MTINDGVQLERLEIENFKSYKGSVIIGPLKPFTAVIGPNGSGKSNFMDAISFVFGEQARSLRVKKLNELIHGSNVDHPASSKCSVTAVLMVNGEEKHFQRVVKVSGNDAISDYRIDGKSVGNKQYMEALEELSIVIKPRNFLVFQGQVEQIATMNPKQRTQMIEKISRSGELKEEYDRLEKELESAEEEMRKAHANQKESNVEEKEAKEDKKLADDYQKKVVELDKEKTVLQMFELFHKDREIEEIKEEISKQKDIIADEEAKRKEVDEKIKTLKKRLQERTKELTKLDGEIRTAEGKLQEAKPAHIAVKAKIEFNESKIAADERMANAAKETMEKQKTTIERLEKDKRDVESARDDYEQGFTQTQDAQNLTQLTEEQLDNYNQLKQEAERQTSNLSSKMEDLKRENKKDRELVTAERQALAENLSIGKQAMENKDGYLKRLDRLNENINSTKAEKTKAEEQRDALQDSFEGVDERIATIEKRLKEISNKLADMRVDERELARRAKKEDLVNKLKQLFGEENVLGRLIELCHHSAEKYQLAVTKVMAKNMSFIVVTTQEIANQCIVYMKQQEIEPEGFLPLNALDVRAVTESLRRLDPENVKLIIDVIQITHPDKASVQKAVRFVCGNAITCEDQQRAKGLAYGKERYQVVTWKGTLFDRSGVISGGAAELRSKAKRWDEKETTKLKAEQQKLSDELRECNKIRRKESEIRDLSSKIQSLENRLKYSGKDKSETEAQLRDIEVKIHDSKKQEEIAQRRVRAAEEKAASSGQRLKDLEKQLNSLEDDIFATFCGEIGVSNIRQYEAREVGERQEREKRLVDYTTQINRLNQQIIFEKNKLDSTKKKVEKFEDALVRLKQELEVARSDEKKKEVLVEQAEKVVDELKDRREELKKAVDERENDMEEQRKELAAVTKRLATLNRQIAGEEAKREQLKVDRRGILQHCKMNNVELYFEEGTMEDIGLAVASSSNDLSLEASSSQEIEDRESRIKLDYNKLPQKYKKQGDHAEIKKESDRMQSRIQDMEGALEKMSLPKQNAGERLGEIKNKARQTTAELNDARKKVLSLTNQFKKVKEERLKRFNKCIETVAESIDRIYKELVNEESAQAFLNADNQETPFDGGIIFSLVVPGKNYRPIDSLSGGEKTLASLSLLFAIHAASPSPFFIMDEIDAALDNTNILRVAQFMSKRSKNEFQIIIISLKEEMYHHVDALVGIYSEPADVCISRNLTLDLTQYDRTRPERGRKAA